MSKEKQIEEMAKVIETTEQIARDAHCGYPSPRMYAKDLYWHGYRKQSEGRWEKIAFGNLVTTVRCGNCGEREDLAFYEKPYCPNCGAKMKGA